VVSAVLDSVVSAVLEGSHQDPALHLDRQKSELLLEVFWSLICYTITLLTLPLHQPGKAYTWCAVIG